MSREVSHELPPVASDSYGLTPPQVSCPPEDHRKPVAAGSCNGGSMIRLKLSNFRPLRPAAVLGIALFGLFAVTPLLHAADPDDFDAYKVRISGFWFYSSPSGDIQGSTENGVIDLQKDLGFANYSTFSGKLDWKFTRKNHIYIAASPFSQSRQTVLARTIVFQGQTFSVGLVSHAQLKANLYAPGYQYDIIRRKRGNLGIAAQIDLFDSSASINAAAQVTSDGVHHGAVSAKGSLLAPIPVFGPQFRYYLTDSPRVFVEQEPDASRLTTEPEAKRKLESDCNGESCP